MGSDLKGALKELNDVLLKNLSKLDDAPSSNKSGKEGAIRTDLVDVHVKIIFLKVGEIQTVAEKFNADVFIQARWREPALDASGVEGDFPDAKNYWSPKLSVDNALTLTEDVWYTLTRDENGEAYICQKRRSSGTFYERMELMEYPCDAQDLSVHLTTRRGEHELRLHLDADELSTVNVTSFVDEQEWKLHKHVVATNKVTTNAYKNSAHKHPVMTLSCKAARRSWYFVWNIILIMIFIASLVFTTFTVSQEKIENRLQLSFILLLSNITFKFTINQTLPRVSYLTLMDKYIIGTMAQICLVCVWHAILSRVNDSEDTDQVLLIDRIVFAVLASAYLIFNLVFLVISQVIKRRHQKYNRRDEEQSVLLEGKLSRASAGATVVPVKYEA